jgi:Protein of unknown function (DUF2795)
MAKQTSGSDSLAPIDIQRYLIGIDYPVQKNDVIKKAQENNAPDVLVRLLQRMPEGSFNQPIDVMKSFGNRR